MIVTLESKLQTRAGGAVELTHIETGTVAAYPVKGRYLNLCSNEWCINYWTLSGKFDMEEEESDEDLVAII